LVRGDLDWIVMKCLEKDRTRRYETANGLAADIQRHINNEPVVASPPSNGVSALAFGPNGKWLASASGTLTDGGDRNPSDRYVDTMPLPSEVKLWDLATRQSTLTFTGHTKSILSLAISPDGQRLATGSADGTVRLWDITTKQMQTNLNQFSGPIFAVAFSPDGHSLAVGGGNPFRQQAELKMLDLETFTDRMTFKGHQGPVFALAFSPNGHTLASGGLDQIVRFWDVVTGDQARSIQGHRAPIWSLAWDPDG
jgi:WD40 repeat protein